MLMNLTMLRDLDWMAMWRRVAEKELMVMLHTALADQVLATVFSLPYLSYLAVVTKYYMPLLPFYKVV